MPRNSSRWRWAPTAALAVVAIAACVLFASAESEEAQRPWVVVFLVTVVLYVVFRVVTMVKDRAR